MTPAVQELIKAALGLRDILIEVRDPSLYEKLDRLTKAIEQAKYDF